ncbi:ATP-grasp domain-containing protein [Winogradskyella litoriviva]|uniref:protein-tyrosine-phosphatase n=1 Tax=Winogradskyella litoriviva TaxID=1220182 RepID=A0ABX2E628_9FLAO|nr:ATP-grasp domain-containing protein [Winogradskyella litoriviva]NRD23239.1 ATP-grasp domain-containing protein [Winogradskyella litoriviva]
MKKPSILLTNIHERSALGALQSLETANIRVIKATTVKGLQSLDKKENVILHPCPIEKFYDFKNWITEFVNKNEGLFVFPINEGIVFACESIRIEHADIEGRFIMPSHNSLKYTLSKFNATQAAQDAGLKIPKTFFIREAFSEVTNIPNESLNYPLILKWDNVLNPSGIYEKGSLRVVDNYMELVDSVAELKPISCSIILQQMVPGYGVGAFFLRKNGKIVLRFAHRRLHEVPWTGGVSAYCESSNNQEVLDAGEKLLEAIDYDGLAMVEFRKEDGKSPKFLEINGRLWGSLGLALRAEADFPKAMVESFLNGYTKVKQPDLERIVKWHEPRFDMLYLRSLWTETSKFKDEEAPKFKGAMQVALNFVNPTIGSDWMKPSEPWLTIKRYLRLLKNELGQIKRNLSSSKKKKHETPDIVLEGIKRTELLRNKFPQIKNILFVCYGNICRSSYTEFRWEAKRESNLELPKSKSVGFHNNVGRSTPLRFQSVARNLGVELSGHRSKRITSDLVNEADLLIVMDQRNLEDVKKEFPEAIIKTILLGAIGDNYENAEIQDPYGQKIGTGGAIYRRLDKELNKLEELILTK